MGIIPFFIGANANKTAKKIIKEAEAKRRYQIKHDIQVRGIPFTKEWKRSMAIMKKKNAQMIKTGAWKKELNKEIKKKLFQ